MRKCLSLLLLASFGMALLGSFALEGLANREEIDALRRQRYELESQTKMMRRKKLEKLRAAKTLNTHIYVNQMKLEGAKRSLVGQQNYLDLTKNRFVYLTQKLDHTLGDTARLTNDASLRLRSLYSGENVSLLQMIVDANDIATLLDRLYYKQKLVAQDKKILEELRKKTAELNFQKQELALRKQQIARTIVSIQSYKLQIADRIQADSILRDKYKNDAAYYTRAENQLLAESSSIRLQILNLTRRQTATAVPITSSTGRFMLPIHGVITSRFGYRTHPIHRLRLMHTGLDISGPNRGSVKAADGGQVLYVGWRGGYGKVVMINHGNRNGVNLVSLYGHLSGYAVSSGQSVSKGQVIGYEGSTGFSTGPHVHFEIRENGSPVDPMRYVR